MDIRREGNFENRDIYFFLKSHHFFEKWARSLARGRQRSAQADKPDRSEAVRAILLNGEQS
jgi:hypothetical protein